MICTPPGKMRGSSPKEIEDAIAGQEAEELPSAITRSKATPFTLVPKLLFGNAGFETPFRATRETEFPGVRSQTEFGNEESRITHYRICYNDPMPRAGGLINDPNTSGRLRKWGFSPVGAGVLPRTRTRAPHGGDHRAGGGNSAESRNACGVTK